jgi:hypothetical protein
MFKVLLFLGFFISPAFRPAPAPAPCTCPTVSNLQTTVRTASSLAFTWDGSGSGAQYKVWYVRHADSHFSGYFYPSGASYHFTGLSAGSYTFYFQTLCGEETSEYIGVEDTISG